MTPVARPGATVLWAAVGAAAFGAALAVSRMAPAALIPEFQRPVMAEYAQDDMTSTLMGARRFGADMAFLQLLQYYASDRTAGPAPLPEGGGDEGAHAEHRHAGSEGTADLHPDERLDSFPRLRDYALRAAALDPAFHYVTLFAASALAFNLNRGDEALDLLLKGWRADPTYWQYRLYAGAIGFRQKAQAERATVLLEEAIAMPDCPTMLQNIVANIHKQRGNYVRAAQIFLRITQTSRDPNYVETARRKLEELRRDHGVSVS